MPRDLASSLQSRSQPPNPSSALDDRATADTSTTLPAPISRPDEESAARNIAQTQSNKRLQSVFADEGQPIPGIPKQTPVAPTDPSDRELKTIVVRKHDTLEGLAKHFHVSPEAIMLANGYKKPRALSPGQSLIIPRSNSSLEYAALPTFLWPVQGRIIAAFGDPINAGGTNSGIDISVPEGTPVKAAAKGVVAYAGYEFNGISTEPKAYGNVILIRHADNYVTSYTNLSQLLVKKGDTVDRGQVIGNSGLSTGANIPELHFELRAGAKTIDPRPLLNGT